MGLPGFCATRVIRMRLSTSSTHLRTLLAVPFLAAMLVFPASAEDTPSTSSPQAQTAPAAQSAPEAAAPEAAAPDTQAAAGQTAPEGSDANQPAADSQPDAKAPSGQPEPIKPEEKAATTTPKSSVVINVDKSSQEMTVFVDGIEQYSWPVSTGMRGYSTPSGSYTTRSMNKIWYSKQWDNAPMPHAVFFTKEGHAIHGTQEVKRLGKPASHGCVRLSPDNAAKLYALVDANGLENTQVVLTGTTPGGEAKVASDNGSRQPKAYPPWFAPNDGFYQQPQQRRRGFFGRRWFQPYAGEQGYYAPRNYRGYGRGY
jgi:lipoprotein-anchoring transpeptidase ErfK/SrfK